MSGELLVISWGGTFGAVRTAVRQALGSGKSVAHAHLRYLNPFPRNLEQVLRSYRKVIVPEINLGQLSLLLRARFLLDIVGINEMRGKMFQVSSLVQRTREILAT